MIRPPPAPDAGRMALRSHRVGAYHRGVTRFLDALRGSHVRLWLLAILATVAIGTAGYVLLGWSLDDAAYMTGITLTTVGYKEVRELDDLGRAVDRRAGGRRRRDHLRIDRHRRRGGPVRDGERATGGETDG